MSEVLKSCAKWVMWNELSVMSYELSADVKANIKQEIKELMVTIS